MMKTARQKAWTITGAARGHTHYERLNILMKLRLMEQRRTCRLWLTHARMYQYGLFEVFPYDFGQYRHTRQKFQVSFLSSRRFKGISMDMLNISHSHAHIHTEDELSACITASFRSLAVIDGMAVKS